MAKNGSSFLVARTLGLELPGVAESAAYGQPALKVNGKILACVPANRSAEPGSLAVRVDFGDREKLLAAAPGVYYVTEHYAGHPIVLVRLSRIGPEALRELLGTAYKFVTRKTAAAVPVRKQRKPKGRS